MVNIVGIVIIHSDSVRAYTSFDSWWQTTLDTSSPTKRQKRIEFKEKRDKLALKLANKYEIPIENMKNVGFLFSTKLQVKEVIADHEDRSLLCDPQTSIVIQLRLEQYAISAIVVAHSKERTKIFNSSIALNPPEIESNEQ